MATNRNETNQEEQNPPWLGFAKFLFIVILTVTVFLLVRSMVGHHFFSGGQQNRHAATGPQQGFKSTTERQPMPFRALPSVGSRLVGPGKRW